MIKSLHYSYCLSILSKINTKHYKFFTRNIIEIEEKTNNKIVIFVLMTCWPYTIQGTYCMSPLHHMAWLNKTSYIFVFTSILETIFALAFTSQNSILSYFTIPKNYFFNYIIQFYNTLSILTFILHYNTLK